MLAVGRGFTDWQDLMVQTLDVDYSEGGEMPLITRRLNRDELLIDLPTPEEFDELTDEASFDVVPQLYVATNLLVGQEPNTVTWEVRLLTQPDAEQQGIDSCTPFIPRVGHRQEYIFEALEDAADGSPSLILELLHKDGFFEIDLETNPQCDEHEALLILAVRKMGLDLGARTTFNTGDDTNDFEMIDWDRRCFANLLGDGSVIVSNGAGRDELIWKVVPGETFDALKAEMEDKLGAEAYSTQRLLVAEPGAAPAL